MESKRIYAVSYSVKLNEESNEEHGIVKATNHENKKKNINSASNSTNLNLKLILTEDNFPAIGVNTKLISSENKKLPKEYLTKKTHTKKNTFEIELIDLINNGRLTSNLKTKHQQSNHSPNSSKFERKKVKQTTVAKSKKLSKFKKEIINCQQSVSKPEAINYYDHYLSNELETLTNLFLSKVVSLQEKYYKRDNIKGRIRKKYVLGFHEVQKYLRLYKIKFIILATDIKIYSDEDFLHKTILELTSLAKLHGAAYIFSLKRRQLGSITMKFIPVSCVGIKNYEGAEVEYKAIHEELVKARDTFKLDSTIEEKRSLIEALNI